MSHERRHVRFGGCFNFRDLGGYATTDGRTVRWGSVYRSGALHNFTRADRVAFHKLGIKTVIDLRATEELERDGRLSPTARRAFTFAHHPLFEWDDPPFKWAEPGDPEPPPGEDYLNIARAGAAAIASAFEALAYGDHPTVFHCSAGKDRTGVIAALVLATLGVPDDAIAEDYAVSEGHWRAALDWMARHSPDKAAEFTRLPDWLHRTPALNMQAFLDGMRSRHGSIAGYLGDIGVSARATTELRSRLLEG